MEIGNYLRIWRSNDENNNRNVETTGFFLWGIFIFSSLTSLQDNKTIK
jgi:hypothetical protein